MAVRDRRPRLILADDHRVVIDALQRSLEAEFRVVGQAHDGDEVLHVLSRHVADGILLDLDMPNRSGLQVIPSIRRARPEVKIVVLTMHLDRGLAEASIKAGAHGFVPKDAPLEELVAAVHEVLAGRTYVSPRVPRATHRMGIDAEHIGLQRLTQRQQAVLLHLGEGQTLSDISRRLNVSPSTVTFHKHNLMKVLGFDDEAALMQYAVLVRTAIQ